MSATAISPQTEAARSSTAERRFVLVLAATMLAAILLVSFFAPASEDNDPSPSSYNSGSAGVKAAFLLLPKLGYKVERWEQSTSELDSLDAAHTTLVLANPVVPIEDQPSVAGAVKAFLDRGGRVLTTGVQGAYLIPGGQTAEPTQIFKDLCISTPEGQADMALAGPVSMEDSVRWQADTVAVRVQQRCNGDAVAVIVKVGHGDAVWWSTPLPMTNRGLKEDASLKLLLASIGPADRQVLFDESLHGEAASICDQARGLPIRSLLIQCGLVGLLLILSFGRRNGPVRMPLRAVRSSPLEFAESMGHLYNKAGATQVAVAGARWRLVRFLQERCGLPHELLRHSPDRIVEALQYRLGGDWSVLGEHLSQAEDIEKTLSPKAVLELVKAIDRDIEQLGKALNSTRSK